MQSELKSEIDVEQIILKTKQFEFADGLREMQLAQMWAGYGLMTWVVFDLGRIWFPALLELIVRYGRWAGVSTAVVMLVPSLLMLAALLVINVVRRRWLWRKTGTVKPPRIVTPRRVTVISVLILLAGLAVVFGLMQLGLADGNFAIKSVLSLSGVGFGYTMAAMGDHLKLPRFTHVGWIGGLLSLPPVFLPLTIGQFGLVLCGMWAVVMVWSGASPLMSAARAAREPGHER